MRVVNTVLDGKQLDFPVWEMPPEWYDMIYREEVSYQSAPYESSYYPLWFAVMNKIHPAEVVFDLGCGTGQFAELLEKSGRKVALGIDFSPVAIEMAQKRGLKAPFMVGNLYEKDTYSFCEYDCVTLTEVMEHLERDLDVLKMIKPKAHVLFTVPNYITYSHVRGFMDEREVRERYRDLVDIHSITEMVRDFNRGWKVWIVDSYKI